MRIFFSFIPLFFLIGFYSCSPIKASPEDQSHRMELSLHEVQTNVDDSRHDLNCFRTELQIIDSRLKQLENGLNSLKLSQAEKIQGRFDSLNKKIVQLEKVLLEKEEESHLSKGDLKRLSDHANETTEVLSQFQKRLSEIEIKAVSFSKKVEEVSKLRSTLESIADPSTFLNKEFVVYQVKSRDSLEKIAKRYQVTVDAIKKWNNLDSDLIVVGQEIKILSQSP